MVGFLSRFASGNLLFKPNVAYKSFGYALCSSSSSDAADDEGAPPSSPMVAIVAVVVSEFGRSLARVVSSSRKNVRDPNVLWQRHQKKRGIFEFFVWGLGFKLGDSGF